VEEMFDLDALLDMEEARDFIMMDRSSIESIFESPLTLVSLISKLSLTYL
jgi:hypothetical protein